MKLDVVLHCKKNGVVYTAYQMRDNKYLIHLVKRGESKWYELYEFSAIIMDLEIEVDENEEVVPTFTPVKHDDEELPFPF